MREIEFKRRIAKLNKEADQLVIQALDCMQQARSKIQEAADFTVIELNKFQADSKRQDAEKTK